MLSPSGTGWPQQGTQVLARCTRQWGCSRQHLSDLVPEFLSQLPWPSMGQLGHPLLVFGIVAAAGRASAFD